MFKNTALCLMLVGALAAPAFSFSVGSSASLGVARMRLSSSTQKSSRVPSLALTTMQAEHFGIPLREEKKLLGSRRLHRLFNSGKKSVSLNAESEEPMNTRQTSYTDVQPLVALMSKRRLTEYYFTTMGPSQYSLDDSIESVSESEATGAVFLEEHLKGVPDVLTVGKDSEDLYSGEVLVERTAV
mmetsp:Transcript_128679/g.191752  ORF Transcript_128679/g.191752 Transcript_128679/m.191752 type:complete len:185 (-) Transcript_128679:93-647(-)